MNEPKKPGELIIGTTADRILVRIQSDGTLEYGPEYTPDEAAKVFWETLARKRLEVEAQEVLLRHIEGLMQKVGTQDLLYERLKAVAEGEDGTEHDNFQAQRALGQLEVYVHQIIELSRGMALRDEVNEVTQTPQKDLN